MTGSILIRPATDSDLESIRRIYNEGIEDRTATLDTEQKTADDIAEWWSQHDDRFAVLVAAEEPRCAHAAIADLSVYVARSHRGRGVGIRLLTELEQRAQQSGFHKIVLHALNGNEAGKRLYRKSGFTEVGVFREHGMLDGQYVDVVAMEKLLV